MRCAPILAAAALAGCALDDRDGPVAPPLDAPPPPPLDAVEVDAPAVIPPATADAVDDLLAIAHLVLARHAALGEFPSGDIGLTPPLPCCAGVDFMCALEPDLWVRWRMTVGFMPPRPTHSYQYAYAATGSSVFVLAVADLDCDSIQHQLVLRCDVDAAGPSCHLTWPSDLE